MAENKQEKKAPQKKNEKFVNPVFAWGLIGGCFAVAVAIALIILL